MRLAPEDSPAFRDGQGWWRSERKIRRAVGPRVGTGHIPDAEISWPEVPGSAYAGELWTVEAELTARPAARIMGILAGLLARTADYQPGARPGPGPRYARVVYLCAPAARGVVGRAAAALPAPLAVRVTVRDLPPGAVL